MQLYKIGSFFFSDALLNHLNSRAFPDLFEYSGGPLLIKPTCSPSVGKALLSLVDTLMLRVRDFNRCLYTLYFIGDLENPVCQAQFVLFELVFRQVKQTTRIPDSFDFLFVCNPPTCQLFSQVSEKIIELPVLDLSNLVLNRLRGFRISFYAASFVPIYQSSEQILFEIKQLRKVELDELVVPLFIVVEIPILSDSLTLAIPYVVNSNIINLQFASIEESKSDQLLVQVPTKSLYVLSKVYRSISNKALPLVWLPSKSKQLQLKSALV